MKFLGIFNVKERKGRNNFIGETMTTKKLYMGIAKAYY